MYDVCVCVYVICVCTMYGAMYSTYLLASDKPLPHTSGSNLSHHSCGWHLQREIVSDC